MSKLVLYHSPYSPFSRSVLLFCRFLKLDLNVKILDLMQDEQLSAGFLKINPQHCVPTIDDNGFYLWESRAILGYLIESKAPHLIPATPEERAIVNQRLYFEMGGLGKKYADLFVNNSSYVLRKQLIDSISQSYFSAHYLKEKQKSNQKQLKNSTMCCQ